MDDAPLVRGVERVGDLARDRQRVSKCDRAMREGVRERRAFDQLEDDGRGAAGLLQAVDSRDVRMVERGEQFRFTLKARQAIRILRERLGQNFDGDVALQLRVARAIDLAHSAGANRGEDVVDAEPGAGSERHR